MPKGDRLPHTGYEHAASQSEPGIRMGRRTVTEDANACQWRSMIAGNSMSEHHIDKCDRDATAHLGHAAPGCAVAW